jgi:hypothetical protein
VIGRHNSFSNSHFLTMLVTHAVLLIRAASHNFNLSIGPEIFSLSRSTNTNVEVGRNSNSNNIYLYGLLLYTAFYCLIRTYLNALVHGSSINESSTKFWG